MGHVQFLDAGGAELLNRRLRLGVSMSVDLVLRLDRLILKLGSSWVSRVFLLLVSGKLLPLASYGLY